MTWTGDGEWGNLVYGCRTTAQESYSMQRGEEVRKISLIVQNECGVLLWMLHNSVHLYCKTQNEDVEMGLTVLFRNNYRNIIMTSNSL